MNRTIIAAAAAASLTAIVTGAYMAGADAAGAPAATQAQANAHARTLMASCVREHPAVSLAALQAQVTCAVPAAYRRAASQCITLGVTGAREAFTTRRRITQVYAEECMAGSQ